MRSITIDLNDTPLEKLNTQQLQREIAAAIRAPEDEVALSYQGEGTEVRTLSDGLRTVKEETTITPSLTVTVQGSYDLAPVEQTVKNHTPAMSDQEEIEQVRSEEFEKQPAFQALMARVAALEGKR